MTSQQYHLNESAEEAWHTDSRVNPSTPESDIEGDDSTDVALQRAHEDEQALDGFIQAHPLSTAASPPKTSDYHLPCPVVIPQRRPGNKCRGFVEAYAPALEQFGIQQDEFISFVKATNKAVRASKWLSAIQLAAMGTSFVPNSIAMGASVAVQVVAGVMAKAETRWKTNSFLDRVNEDYFRPRGLYCLLMAYKPVTLGEKTQFDVREAMSRARPSSSTSLSTQEQGFPAHARKNLRNPIAGTVKGEESLPSNVAPLVYPSASTASQESRNSAKERNTITRITKYLDDRAQARYAKESTGDVLSQPSPPSFKNRYLDPNHPATNGGLLGLLSGGHLTPNAEKVNQRMQSPLHAQIQAIQEQQSATMDILRQQLTLMDLPPEQEQAVIKQYKDVFQVQEQHVSQQAELVNTGTGQVRTIWVRLIRAFLIFTRYRLIVYFRMFYIL
ncbi:uncharacterized protein A1O9_09541 [Exophiala aquamarina CBS 119918]|uniref:Uncharacterized protein n=1 Tax=Exophiala aquamarina CBS 119918 TaxID=1182545 RepID=A0A072PFR0_9EURO|nr:uncharacterized protein A1O9_09541 [Exophiala aquamarina CBS 119918]KEF54375.1 hypothetical protein A1O9_09541 [Exophiala aquamarina CBS 119918]